MKVFPHKLLLIFKACSNQHGVEAIECFNAMFYGGACDQTPGGGVRIILYATRSACDMHFKLDGRWTYLQVYLLHVRSVLATMRSS